MARENLQTLGIAIHKRKVHDLHSRPKRKAAVYDDERDGLALAAWQRVKVRVKYSGLQHGY
jgi:hypothetical protein